MSAAAAAAGMATLDVRPSTAGQGGDAVTPGRARPLKLGTDRDGLLYVPKGYRADTAMPLVVMLHGAGNTSLSVQYTFPLADELGFIVLAPDSRDERTWDGVLGSWGPDMDFIAAAMRLAYTRCRVDMGRQALAGFSDGASYTLCLGIAAGDVFGHLMAFSPGVMEPYAVRGKPRIFISHGTNDHVMPIDDTSRTFVPRLRKLGYDVTYREFEGRHQLPPPIAHEAFTWFMH